MTTSSPSSSSTRVAVAKRRCSCSSSSKSDRGCFENRTRRHRFRQQYHHPTRGETRTGVRTKASSPSSPKPNPNQMLIYVPPHPLLKHWLAVARNAASPSALFRSAMAEIGKILLYELSRDWLETYEAQVQGPLAVANVEVVDPTKPISIVPILRAGLTLVEKAHEVLPTTKTYHLGYARDEKTLEATKYLDKLPKAGFSKEDKVLISDPMLATGGTIVRAVRDVLDKGADVKNVRVMCCVAAPPALTKLSETFPGLVVYAAMIDENITEEGFILPGLGDAGDRAFGTTDD